MRTKNNENELLKDIQNNHATSCDYVYLSDNHKIELGRNSYGGNNNTVVVGDTGSGKTFSIVVPFLLHVHQHSIVVTLSKKKLVKMFKASFEDKGYKVNIIDLAHPKESKVSYDILNGIKSQQDIVFAAKALVGTPGSSEDRYWYETSASVLSAEIAYVLQEAKRKNKKPSFRDVLALNKKLTITECASGATRTSLDAFFTSEEKFYPGNFASNCWRTVQNLPPKTLHCVLSTLNSSLDKIFTEDVIEMMSIPKALDIPQIGEEKTAVFIVTSAVNPALNPFINLFYSDLFKQLFEYAEDKYEDGVLPVPVHVICDDFACGAKIPDFAKYISIFREKGISVTILLQSESQLCSLYTPYEAHTILNNCANYVYCGSMDMETCHSISIRTNKPLDDIMYMPIDDVIVLRRGEKPYKGHRYPIFDDDMYKSLLLSDKDENICEK